MLTSLVRSGFSKLVQQQGESYYIEKRVKLVTASGDRFRAVVSGEDDYEVTVELDWARRTCAIAASCTCPYARDHGYGCKHVWAMLRYLESEKRIARMPTRAEFYMIDPEDAEVEGDDGELNWEEGEDFENRQYTVEVGGKSYVVPLRVPVSRQLSEEARKILSEAAQRRASASGWSTWLNRVRDAEQSMSRRETAPTSGPPVEPLYALMPPEQHRDQFGDFVLELRHQTPTKSGRLGKLKAFGLKASDVPRLATDVDRRIALFLMGAAQATNLGHFASLRYNPYGYEPSNTRWMLPSQSREMLLPLLFETGRFVFMRDDLDEPTPLTLDDGGPWELCIAFEPSVNPGEHRMAVRLRRGDESFELKKTELTFDGEPGYFLKEGRLHTVYWHGCFGWTEMGAADIKATVKDAERSWFLESASKLRRLPPVSWPAAWEIADVRGVPPVPELYIEVQDGNGQGRPPQNVAGRFSFSYGDINLHPNLASRTILDHEDKRQIHRDLDAERAFRRRLFELGAVENNYDPDALLVLLPTKRLIDIVLTLLEENWVVHGKDKLYRRAGDINIEVSSGIDWFDVDGSVEFDGQAVQLPELLAAMRKGERFVRLGDGSVGIMPEAWIARNAPLLDLGKTDKDKIRFSRTQIGLIDALLAESPHTKVDDHFVAARQKLKDFDGIQARSAPADFVGELRPYQQQGLGWLHFLREFQWGGCLADDMGLGKTVQMLAFLAEHRQTKGAGPSLIVVPKSIVFNWLREAEKFAPQLRTLNYTGLERKDLRKQFPKSDLIITTYGLLRQDIAYLAKQEFDYVILDEAQAIKNPKSLSAKAAGCLVGKHRLAMTGTPVENHLGDLWSIFDFLNPGMLGAGGAFQAAFGAGRGLKQDSARLEVLQRTLRPFILRRTKQQVAPELPERSEQVIECEMSPKQAKYYAELRDYYRANLMAKVNKDGLNKSKIHVLEALLRLRQVACHPGLVDPEKRKIESAKLDNLLPMIEELVEEGHKALVFSQFTQFLGILREELDARKIDYEYLDGQTNKRQRCVDRFQNTAKCKLFLISLKAGGVGLNLTAADYVFILDPWWNPAVEAQAIDRTHRIGQDKKIIAYRLIAKDTVEAKVLQLQSSKRELAEAIVTEANSLIQTLTAEDLNLLLS